MKTYQLSKVRVSSPACSDHTDFSQEYDYQRKMRTYRAYTCDYKLEGPDQGLLGTWLVTSIVAEPGNASRSHFVDIVDGSGKHDTCSCPDFMTAGFGTCKHLEAVGRLATKTPAFEPWLKALPKAPATPVLTTTLDENLKLVLAAVGPWTKKALAELGLTPEGRFHELFCEHPDRLIPGEAAGRPRITHAAAALARQRLERRLLAKRYDEIEEAIKNGTFDTNVLALPLFPYQVEGVQHLVKLGRGFLCDDMGLGKTIQALASAEVMRRRGEVKKVLILSPTSMRSQWKREIKKFANIDAVDVVGTKAQRLKLLRDPSPYKLVGYESAREDLAAVMDVGFELLILDEAQRVKNFRTLTVKTVQEIGARFLFVLTGTPLENKLDDMFSLCQLVDRQMFGPLWWFNFNHQPLDERGRVGNAVEMGRFRDTVRHYFLRRMKKDVDLQLPKLTKDVQYVELSATQVRLEASKRRKATTLLARSHRKPLTGEEMKILSACLLKARQACNAAELCEPGLEPGRCAKLDLFSEQIQQLHEQGEGKVLVFSEWVEMLKLAGDRLKALEIPYLTFTGGVPQKKREKVIQDFFSDPLVRVMLISDAGGAGLNLQAASYVIHLDLPWNPAKIDQRTSRAHRTGQTHPVIEICLVAATGIERGIEGLLDSKRDLQSAALDMTSDVDTVQKTSFITALYQLEPYLEELARQEALDHQAAADAAPDSGQPSEPAPAPLPPQPTPPKEPPALPPAAVPPTDPTPATAPAQRAPYAEARAKAASHNGRLALFLLEQFPGEAVKAAYEALCQLVASHAPQSVQPGDHPALVAFVYQDLAKYGQGGVQLARSLAELRDLSVLANTGVALPPELVSECVQTAQRWVNELG